MPLEWQLLAAAKARNKTLDEYIAGGWTRWVNIHKEIAFDVLESIQMDVISKGDDAVVTPKSRGQKPPEESDG